MLRMGPSGSVQTPSTISILASLGPTYFLIGPQCLHWLSDHPQTLCKKPLKPPPALQGLCLGLTSYPCSQPHLELSFHPVLCTFSLLFPGPVDRLFAGIKLLHLFPGGLLSSPWASCRVALGALSVPGVDKCNSRSRSRSWGVQTLSTARGRFFCRLIHMHKIVRQSY